MSFNTIVRTHQGPVRTFLRRLCRNSALADELAQDTFISAFRQSERLHTVKSMRPWLLRLAYRRFLDQYRRNMRRRDLADHQPNADAAPAAHPGLALDIDAAMATLAPDRRACALLCLAQGYSHSEASEITGLPLGTVKSHVTRARQTLQERLKAYQEEPHDG